MKRSFKKIALTAVLSLSLVTGTLMLSPAGALAAPFNGGSAMSPMNRQGGMMGPMQNNSVALADTASEIVTGTVTNSAADLTADTGNATSIVVSDENSQVTISESGTYIISGSASDGSVTVKKGTTGVVLILKDLDLTSKTGAAVSVNKDSEVQIVVSGNVTLTDAENPADETSEDAEVADAYDGAAIKVKAGASVYLTGDGTLTVNGNAKNGIKTGDEASLVINGESLTVDITAANDGINASYDLAIVSGTVNISAADDALHADRILTVGTEDGSTSPTINVNASTEGLEGTIVNIHSGSVTVNAADDAINAANSDGTYENELTYAINVTGGTVVTNSRADGLDSNGNVNLVGGTVTIQSSARNGGDAGVDYDGQMYVSADATLNNANGVAGPDMMPGMMNGQMGMPGQMGQTSQNGRQTTRPGFAGQNGQADQNGQQITPPDFDGQNGQADQNGQQAALPDVDASSHATSGSQQQMTPPDFDGQNGQADQNGQMPQNGQQMAPPAMNGQRGWGMTPPGMNGQFNQMMPPDFNNQNFQMAGPDFSGQNGQLPPAGMEDRAPDLADDNN